MSYGPPSSFDEGPPAPGRQRGITPIDTRITRHPPFSSPAAPLTGTGQRSRKSRMALVNSATIPPSSRPASSAVPSQRSRDWLHGPTARSLASRSRAIWGYESDFSHSGSTRIRSYGVDVPFMQFQLSSSYMAGTSTPYSRSRTGRAHWDHGHKKQREHAVVTKVPSITGR